MKLLTRFVVFIFVIFAFGFQCSGDFLDKEFSDNQHNLNPVADETLQHTVPDMENTGKEVKNIFNSNVVSINNTEKEVLADFETYRHQVIKVKPINYDIRVLTLMKKYGKGQKYFTFLNAKSAYNVFKYPFYKCEQYIRKSKLINLPIAFEKVHRHTFNNIRTC